MVTFTEQILCAVWVVMISYGTSDDWISEGEVSVVSGSPISIVILGLHNFIGNLSIQVGEKVF